MSLQAQFSGISSHKSSRKLGKDSLDFAPTPPWGTRAVCERLYIRSGMTAADPCCGKLDMVYPLREYFAGVEFSDVHDYGVSAPIRDFLMEDFAWPVHWYIMNPPFKLALEFILTALRQTKYGVAALVRTNFLAGKRRYRELFGQCAPTYTLQFVERLPMVMGRLDPDAKTQTDYMWLVWQGVKYRKDWNKVFADPPHPMKWILPCRSRLERPTDYDQYLEPLGLAP